MSRDSNAEDAELQSAERLVRQRSGRPRPPQRIGDAISRLFARRGYARVESTRQLQQRWRQLVGVLLADISRPTRLRRGVLEIVVCNSAALQELTFQRRQLLRQLQASEHGKGVRELRFRVGPLD